VTGGKDDMIRAWDPAKGELIKPDVAVVWKTYPIDFITALDDDKFAVSCTKPGGTCINSLGTVSKGVEQGFGAENARGLAIASDGKTWALVPDGQKRKPIQQSFPPIQDGLKDFEGEHDGNIRAAAFSPDNATLATASEDKTVKLWDCGTGKERTTCKGPTQPLVCVAFAPDGKIVAAGSTDGTVWVWDATTAKEVATLRGHEGTVNCLTFTPNGKVLGTGGDDKTVALWDVATAKRLAVLKGHTGAVRSVAFSRDAGILASGGQDKEVRLWEQAK
jgi:WD40 repeat protein